MKVCIDCGCLMLDDHDGDMCECCLDDRGDTIPDGLREEGRDMRILLINVDSRWNMAVRKMYNYFRRDHDVTMIDLGLSGYPHNRRETIDGSSYDEVYVSNIFDINKDRVTVTGCDRVVFGGIGSRNPEAKLSPEIESTEPYYFPEEDTSYGFITRGCIRNCWFCKVPKYEGKLTVYNRVEDIVKHKKVKFLDNNILAYPGHMDVFQWLIDKNQRCEFNQGLDFRLVNDENLEALSRLNYMGDYIFAFDDIKYEAALNKKIGLMKKYLSEPWRIKFYIYHADGMPISDLIYRVEWCRAHECKPYVMRDANTWGSDQEKFYIDYASYCNQPAYFKKVSFEEYLHIRHDYRYKKPNLERIQFSLGIYKANGGR